MEHRSGWCIPVHKLGPHRAARTLVVSAALVVLRERQSRGY
jgi:hypothetical protein